MPEYIESRSTINTSLILVFKPSHNYVVFTCSLINPEPGRLPKFIQQLYQALSSMSRCVIHDIVCMSVFTVYVHCLIHVLAFILDLRVNLHCVCNIICGTYYLSNLSVWSNVMVEKMPREVRDYRLFYTLPQAGYTRVTMYIIFSYIIPCFYTFAITITAPWDPTQIQHWIQVRWYCSTEKATH